MKKTLISGIAALASTVLILGCPAATKGSLTLQNPAATAAGGSAVAGGNSGGSNTSGGNSGAAPGTTPETTPGTAVTPGGQVIPPSAGSPVGAGSNGASGGNRSVVACPVETFQQMERLARPGINEGLVRKTSLLNAYNSIPPSLDLVDSDYPTFGPTVVAVRTDAVITLSAFTNVADGEATAAATAAETLGTGDTDLIVANFLPDVMRIDTTMPSGYVGGDTTPANPDGLDSLANVTLTGRLVGGRWLTDDVIDATLLYIIPNSLIAAGGPLAGVNLHSDGVRYTTSHTTLPYTSFPYLVNPY